MTRAIPIKEYIPGLKDRSVTLDYDVIYSPATTTVATTASGYKADYYTDGTADDVEINAAVAYVTGLGGGEILILGGQYNLAAPIAITSSKVSIRGQGKATQLFVANNANLLAALTLIGSGVTNCKIRNLYINCNGANQSNGDGIYVSTPWLNGQFDANHVFEDIYIESPKNNGFEVALSSDTRVLHLNRVRVRGASGNGFYFPVPSSTDNIFTDCIAEVCALNGFYVGCLNSHFTNCKAFYCGSAGGNNQGFNIVGYNNYFDICEAQDNYQSGFYGDGTVGDATYHNQYCTFVNCIADSNGQNGGSTYAVGLQAVNCTGWQVIGGIYMTRPYPDFTQRIGISLEGTTNSTTIVDAKGTGNSTSLISDTSSGLNTTSGSNRVYTNGTFSNIIQFQVGVAGTTAADHAVTIHQRNTLGSLGAALNVVSDNPNTSAMLLTGVEKALGTLKIKHTGQADGSDSSAAAISIDLQTAGTAGKGLYIDSTASGGTTGFLAQLRNQTVDKFTVGADGTVTLPVGKLVLTTGNAPASAGAAGVTGQIAWDSGFIYFCVSTNTWKRVAIATW